MKTTPGPWRIGKDENGCTTIMAEGELSRGFPGKVSWCIAYISGGRPGKHEKKGNAALIAAAPDLLDALKDARFALYGIGAGNPKIDAAIAKAEGKEGA